MEHIEMTRAPITEKALNEKIMAMLTARASCTDARSVMLETVVDSASGDNWRIGHFDPGQGDRYKCKLALRAIHEDLKGQFDLVGSR